MNAGFALLLVILLGIVILGAPAAVYHSPHATTQRIKMATAIRHKGPIVGQTVLYVTSGTTMPAIIRSVNADGSVNLTTFPGGSVCTDANSVDFAPSGAIHPSWYWSDDL